MFQMRTHQLQSLELSKKEEAEAECKDAGENERKVEGKRETLRILEIFFKQG